MCLTSEFDLLKFCQKLAHRYKTTQEYEDLVNEGYLAAAQKLSEGGTQDQATGAARRAMSKYMTSVSTPVDIPASSEVTKALGTIRRGEDLSKYSSVLVNALVNTQEPVQPNTLRSDTTLEEEFIQRELNNNLKYILYFWLKSTESYIIHRLFFEEASVAEVAKELGMTRQGLYFKVDEILWKLKKYLTEKGD